MEHTAHENHSHAHGVDCGHTQIKHGNHTDFLHDGRLHAAHEGHFDECSLEVSGENPAECNEIACSCGGSHADCSHEQIPHGDHADFLIDGRLHHAHNGHCDDHGAVYVV